MSILYKYQSGGNMGFTKTYTDLKPPTAAEKAKYAKMAKEEAEWREKYLAELKLAKTDADKAAVRRKYIPRK
jgi:hypothetical protein